jgi:hypothetical protein
MPVIEGSVGPYLLHASPVNGTDEVNTLTFGGTPTGGTFRLGFGGFVSPSISWSNVNNTLLANILAGLTGVAEVQTITFGGTPTGQTFRLMFMGQQTAAITWSSTNTTLRDNVDTALEANPYIGTSGVTTSVGTMTNGIGTLTVTFAVKGPQPLITVSENRLAGTAPTVMVSRTTPGVHMPSIGSGGVTTADVDLVAGIGSLTITLGGTNLAKKAQPTITVEENALTGTAPTIAVVKTTPGVSASFRGAALDALLVGDDALYINSGTAQLPVWTLVGPV